MMAKRCYYESLSVERTASDGDIKAAFRKQAMVCHPDRNPGDQNAEHRFKEINEAYEVLKDPDKRAAYDRYGHAAFEHGMGGGLRLASAPNSPPRSPIFSTTCSAWAAAGAAAAAGASAAPTCATTWKSRCRTPTPARRRKSASRPR